MATHVDHLCIHCSFSEHGWCDGIVVQYGASGSRPIEARCLCTDDLHNPYCLCTECRGSGWVILVGSGGDAATGSQSAREGEPHVSPCLSCDNRE